MRLRKLHMWIALFFSVPLLVIFTSGILLSISPKIEWLQPKGSKLTSGVDVSFSQILETARTVPDSQIETWEDISSIDVRPAAGVIRVRSRNYWEVEIDGHSGKLLQAAPRRKTLLVKIHEGGFFGEWVRYGIFFPAGVGAVALWITGIWIWVSQKLWRKIV